METHYFSTPAEFRDWLGQNHHSATEILVGLYKSSSAQGRRVGVLSPM